MTKLNYGRAILAAFEYLLDRYPETFVIGQGLWSPWYVGSSMTDLDKKFGKSRIIDTPVSEASTTAAALGASIAGSRPIVVHPRMDFMLYAMDGIVNQAAKWSYMFGGQVHPNVTIRSIINRGGEQGAQHSQALQSWLAHVPGLRVVMPYSVADARDLLVASVLCDDPVCFIDDRWLYEQEDTLDPVKELNLRSEGPRVIRAGVDITIVGSSYSSLICMEAAEGLSKEGVSAEVIDLRVISPLNVDEIVNSIGKTRALLVVDGGWEAFGVSAEVITATLEQVSPQVLKSSPQRLGLPPSPAPTSRPLEKVYYPNANLVVERVHELLDTQVVS